MEEYKPVMDFVSSAGAVLVSTVVVFAMVLTMGYLFYTYIYKPELSQRILVAEANARSAKALSRAMRAAFMLQKECTANIREASRITEMNERIASHIETVAEVLTGSMGIVYRRKFESTGDQPVGEQEAGT